MYIRNYTEKLALEDLRSVLRPLIQPAEYPIPPAEIEGAQSRLELLNSREIIALVLSHFRNGVSVNRRMPDGFTPGKPERPNHGGRFGSLELPGRTV